jgi:hypothetical protein
MRLIDKDDVVIKISIPKKYHGKRISITDRERIISLLEPLHRISFTDLLEKLKISGEIFVSSYKAFNRFGHLILANPFTTSFIEITVIPGHIKIGHQGDFPNTPN